MFGLRWLPGVRRAAPALLTASAAAEAGATVAAAGECDLTRSAGVQNLYNDGRLRLHQGTGWLRVDLTHVTRMDTKLVAALIALKRCGLASGQRIEVLCSDPVRDWLRVYRLESVLAPTDAPDRQGRSDAPTIDPRAYARAVQG